MGRLVMTLCCGLAKQETSLRLGQTLDLNIIAKSDAQQRNYILLLY